jgi:hypothetical protein
MQRELTIARQFLRELELIHANCSDPNVRATVLIGVRKAIGQLSSARHEVMPILHALQKGRKVGRQKYGDVHVGHKTDLYSKTIELKSKSDAYTTNVDHEIKKAITQLSGLAQTVKTTVKGRPGDVWVVDLLIINENACWPYPGSNTPRPTGVTLRDLVQKALTRLEGLVKTAWNESLGGHLQQSLALPTQGLGGLATPSQIEYADLGQTTYEVTTRGALFGGHSTRPLLVEKDEPNSVINRWRIPALTIKVRYGSPYEYPVIPTTYGGPNAVAELKFQMTGYAPLRFIGSKTLRI